MTYITNIELKNVAAISTTHTSVQNAGAYGQTDPIDGSVVPYTPLSASSKVIYELSFYSDSQNRTNTWICNIQQSTNSGASWTNIHAHYSRNYGISKTYAHAPEGQDQRFYLHYQFIIPSWSGSRMLRTTISGSLGWVTDADLHIITDWDGTSSTKYCNTSLLVHEVS